MKRFYKQATVGEAGGAFQVLLDGHPLKTPSGAAFLLPTQALADAIAQEWQGTGDEIDTHKMPLTRLAFAAVDSVAKNRDHIVEQVLGFGRSDLLSYRAEYPSALIVRQEAVWDPYLDWAEERYGARLVTASGIIHTPQPDAAIAALEKTVRSRDDFALAALHAATTLTGSLVLALALIDAHQSAEAIFAAATVDETFQAEKWGTDSEAKARLDAHFAELSAAERFVAMLKD
jgi:chaperone required for assembly of F1-ATPase